MSTSWITGARRNYAPNLNIQGDAEAIIEFLEEPSEQNFGTKEVERDQNGVKVKVQIPDIRVRAKVLYKGGTARSKRKGEDSLPAKRGTEYTLWIGTVLSGKFLDGLNWNDPNTPPKMVGTSWRIWRGEIAAFGRRTYEAELITGENYVPPPPPSQDDLDEQLISSLKTAIIRLEDIDTATWYNFCKEKGAKDEADAKRITQKMADQGILRIEATQIFSNEIDE